jgi:hypothetical protein
VKLRLIFGAAVLALGAAVLTTAPAASAATRECDGLQICVPVAGPWVVVPTAGTSRAHVEYQLDCPRGYIVGGLDAELSTPAIDVSFSGNLGSPVNPGITTSSSAVFSATYVGTDSRAAASVRPHVGCIPASGGGGRVPTAASATFPPGRPTTRRVRNVRLRPGASSVTGACASGERLLAASHAIGFYTQTAPSASLAAAVRTRQVLRGSHVTVSIQAGKRVAGVRAVIQVGAICAGGK